MLKNERYLLYPKAIEDLESIYLYSTREFGLKRTEGYILAIETSFQHLASDPLISRKCDYIYQDLRAFNVGSHVIFLKITDYGIAGYSRTAPINGFYQASLKETFAA